MALSRYLRGMLFELTPLDPTTYLIVTLLFAAVALVAAYLADAVCHPDRSGGGVTIGVTASRPPRPL